MIFLASTLVMNGGTTFLIRIAKEFQRRGKPCAVVLLTPRYDTAMRAQLANYAHVIEFWSFLRERGRLARGLLGVFAPLNVRALVEELAPFGSHLHAMGIFGLILGRRLVNARNNLRLSVGVYHQNEFLFRAEPAFFPAEARRMFKAVPAANIVFFNESSRQNYVNHFGANSLLASPVLPIGIELTPPPLPRGKPGHHIVSIGNLVAFKAYNRHMIGIVARLRKTMPAIRYSIYGTGADGGGLEEAGCGTWRRRQGRLPWPVGIQSFSRNSGRLRPVRRQRHGIDRGGGSGTTGARRNRVDQSTGDLWIFERRAGIFVQRG